MSIPSLSPNSLAESSENSELNLSELDLRQENVTRNADLDLTDLLSSLSINSPKLSSKDKFNFNLEKPESLNMSAPPHFDAKILEIVPKFDGNPLELSSYLETANTLISNFWDTRPDHANCVQNVTIIYGIYSKLIGKAREVYSISINKDWQSIKTSLIAHFGDQRDENGLLFDLDQLRQTNHETPLQFHTRVMSNLSALHNYIDTHETIEATKQLKKQFYNTHALKIFLAGLKEPLGSSIRAMRPECLASARQFIISENNIRHLQKPHIPQVTPKFNVPTFTQYFPNQPFQNQQFNQFNQPFRQNFPSNFSRQTKPVFPSQPIDIRPRQLPPPKFFTNKQVFGTNKNTNVFKPRNIPQNQFPKPTPMSGISHGTFPKPPVNQQRYFNPPHFVFEELHNVEQNDNEPYISNNEFEGYQYSYPEQQYYSESEYADTHTINETQTYDDTNQPHTSSYNEQNFPDINEKKENT